jgi:adenylosuccinate lyase
MMHERLRNSSRAWLAIRDGGPNPLVEALASDEVVLRYLSANSVRQIMSAGTYVGYAPEKAREMVQALRNILAGG